MHSISASRLCSINHQHRARRMDYGASLASAIADANALEEEDPCPPYVFRRGIVSLV